MYNIEIVYRTGNSFGSEIKSDLVGCIWDDLNEAKAALQCIKLRHESDSSDYSLNVTVNGEEVTINAFWVGYFESLISATIVIDGTDISFEV